MSMKTVVPDYYPLFRCKAGECAHSCCVGWEIDIDEDTLELYRAVPGELGIRLQDSIECGDECAHFKLGEDERCPFLNGRGLCDIIITLGEGALCDICHMHPRFVNELSQRTETGLGLTCEAAAELMLSRTEPMHIITLEEGEESLTEWEREMLSVRERAFSALQDRSKPFHERLEEMLALCGAHLPKLSLGVWAEHFAALERLDGGWEADLATLRAPAADRVGFEWDTAFEQLACYFVYRYFSVARDAHELAAFAAFCALSCNIIRALFERSEHLAAERLWDICRMYSSEIEYSTENVERLLEILRRK